MLGMDVILLEEFRQLGGVGDVVKVRVGFARNFLLPRGKAVRANESNRKVFEANRERIEAQNAERRAAAEADAKDIDGATVQLIRQASNTGQLYGSVSARDLAELLNAKGHKVARYQIVLDRPIKAIGMQDVRIALHPEVSVTIHVNVARSVEEAELQVRGVDLNSEVPEEEGSPSDDAVGFESRDAAVAALHAEFGTLVEELTEQGLDQLGDLLEKARHVIQNSEVIAGTGVGPLVGVAVGRGAVDKIATDDLSIDWAQSKLLGAAEMAKELNISPATLATWRRDGHVIAFKRDRRNFYYPQRQAHRGAVIEGLIPITRHFAQVEDAWEWLVTPNIHTQGLPPIDRLRLGAREEVERAVEGSLDFT
jgi:large subunit ribosomal protein L9